FQQGVEDGYERIIIIGSDMLDLDQQDLEEAFSVLNRNDFVVGPAEDGGYYLLGMRRLKTELFQNKNWGTSSVLKDTLSNLENEMLHLLPEKNDIDYYEDIKEIEAFQQFLRPLK
ncbi:MAG: glycosyltransferase, partial [Bacteroidetes bacterium]